MAVTAKRLAQTALSTTVTNRYTAPASTTGQITEMWLVNTGATDRVVSLYQGGTAASNTIATGIKVPANGSVILGGCKIVVAAGQSLAAKQDVGTDVILTAFGIEEA